MSPAGLAPGDAMFILRVLLCISLMCLLGTPSAWPAGGSINVDVTIDEARLIRLDADAAQIIVGNPAIADATVQSARLLVITGKSYGATNIIALDEGDTRSSMPASAWARAIPIRSPSTEARSGSRCTARRTVSERSRSAMTNRSSSRWRNRWRKNSAS